MLKPAFALPENICGRLLVIVAVMSDKLPQVIMVREFQEAPAESVLIVARRREAANVPFVQIRVVGRQKGGNAPGMTIPIRYVTPIGQEILWKLEFMLQKLNIVIPSFKLKL